jgi:2-iminobutanoate/2-iminopropanoate deaminase
VSSDALLRNPITGIVCCARAVSGHAAARLLEKHGATLADIAKMVTYLTDVRYQPDFGKCRQEPFGTIPMPAHTLLTISQLAWPGMIIEIDVTAMVPLK